MPDHPEKRVSVDGCVVCSVYCVVWSIVCVCGCVCAWLCVCVCVRHEYGNVQHISGHLSIIRVSYTVFTVHGAIFYCPRFPGDTSGDTHTHTHKHTHSHTQPTNTRT